MSKLELIQEIKQLKEQLTVLKLQSRVVTLEEFKKAIDKMVKVCENCLKEEL